MPAARRVIGAISAAVLAITGSASVAVGQQPVTASSGPVSVRIDSTVQLGPDGEGTTDVTVTRAGSPTIFTGMEGGEGRFGPSIEEPIVIRDLDADGEPEILLRLYSGGAHCCTRAVLVSWDPSIAGYSLVTRDFENGDWDLTDLDGDGAAELLSSDHRFAYLFASYADSGAPILVLRVRAGRFDDVTREYPAWIRASRDDAWRSFVTARRRGSDGRGQLAAYVAESYLLGDETRAWRRVYAAERRRDRARFFRALRIRLVRLGYRPTGAYVPPVPRVAPEVPVIGCLRSWTVRASRRPRACVVYTPGTGDAGYQPLGGLTWRRWGAGQATAVGWASAANQETGRVRRVAVSIRASRPVRGCDGRLWYTVVAIRFGRTGPLVLNPALCPGSPN